MPESHDTPTVAAMAVLASGAATLLHEGLGHGVPAWLLGCHPTELTSNHLSTEIPNHWVSAGGTLVNLAVGAIALALAQRAGANANRRYFLWLLAALNLLPGAGYFLYSGIAGIGDWYAIVAGLPHEGLWRIALALFGGVSYYGVVLLLGRAVRPFVGGAATYNAVGRWPYVVAGLFSIVSGLLDPLGLELLLISTVAAALGGSSGLLWADSVMPQTAPAAPLVVRRQPAWWIAALVLGGAYTLILGPGVKL